MANPKTASILSFYQGLFQDISALLPEVDLSETRQILCDLIHQHPADGLRLLCDLGKNFEASLVTLRPLVVPEKFDLMSDSLLPRIMFPLFFGIFDSSTGIPRDWLSNYDSSDKGLSALYVLILRQFFLAFSKAQDIDCSADQSLELTQFENRLTRVPQITLDSRVISTARFLLHHFFYDDVEDDEPCADLTQWVNDPFGRHGPGAVAGGEVGFDKWDFDYHPQTDGHIYWAHPDCNTGSFVPVSDITVPGCARATVVPKDLRKHRIICIEPKELMFAQQGLMQVIYERLARHPLLRKSVRLRDQDWQGRVSANYLMATLDLKDASDLLSKQLCRLLLPKCIFSLLGRYRSNSIDLGDHVVPEISTMFTMGNALCFPTETLIFWALALSTLMLLDEAEGTRLRWHGRDIRPLSFEHAEMRCLDVRVFGDDIVVPYIYAQEVVSNLTKAGLEVNQNKTCVSTLVRESCGHWYYQGYDCRITRLSYHKADDARAWCSLIENVKELDRNGFSATAIQVARWCEELHPVAYGLDGLPGQRAVKVDWIRFNTELQRLEIRRPTLVDSRDRYARLEGLRGIYAYWTRQATKATIPSKTQCLNWIWVDAYTGKV